MLGGHIVAKDLYTKEVEKLRKEQKKAEEAAARRERAKSIIEAQPIISCFRIMDKNSEELLQIILDHYTENEGRSVSLNYADVPKHMQHSINFELEKLKMYGVLSRCFNYISNCNITISAGGLEYFERKKIAEEKGEVPMQSRKAMRKQYDVFLSHASSDKLSYVDGLYDALSRLKINIFYDKEELSWGDNWKDKLIDGTEKSEFAIIVISEAFFDREWTEWELNGFLQKQNETGQKIILPLLHNISYDDMKRKHPDLRLIQSIRTCDYDNDEITILLAMELIKKYKIN